MKKRILLLSLFTMLTLSAQSQSLVKISPLPFAGGILNASFEVPVSTSVSLQPLLAVAVPTGIFDDASFFAFGLSVRKYLHKQKDAPNGFYLHGGIVAGFGDGDAGVLINGVIGYQWIWESGFVLDLGIGPSIPVGDGIDGGVIPYPIAAIGYQF